jgi:hypothetical protein
LIVASGVLAATASRSRTEAAPPTTSEATTTTTSGPTTAALLAEPPTTSPEEVVTPVPGASGYLIVGVSSPGRLLEVDLSSGAVRTLPYDPGNGTVYHITPLGSMLLLQHENKLVAVDLATGGVTSLGTDVHVLSASHRAALLSRFDPASATQSSELIDAGGARRPVGQTDGAVGLSEDGRILAMRAEQIGWVGPEGGFDALTTGEVLATSPTALVRLACTTASECELRSGPLDEPDRYRRPIEEQLLQASLYPGLDGRYLTVLRWTDGRLAIFDMATGAAATIQEASGGNVPAYSPDGVWLAWTDNGSIHLANVQTAEHIVVDDVEGFANAVAFALQPLPTGR